MATVVLHHGIFAADEIRLGPIRRPGFPGIAEALTAAGHCVVTTCVHPSAAIATRASQLKDAMQRKLEMVDEPVILIAHSLGGLDSRHMLAHLGMADRVKALVTVSTPHRGASIAEFFKHSLDVRAGLYPLFGRFLDIDAATELTRPAVARFNEVTPDHPAVKYFSVTCAQPWPDCGHRYVFSERIIHEHEGPNDGVVSAQSARWGDHLDHWTCGHVGAINMRGLLGSLGPDMPARWVRTVAKVEALLKAGNASGTQEAVAA